MNQRQREFVDHFIAHGLKNATRSAIAAGYSPKIAKVQGCRLRKHPEIRSAIAVQQQELRDWVKFDREMLVARLLQSYYTADNTMAEIEALREVGRVLGLYGNEG